MNNKKKGFTLVELLIVIGILAILTAAVVIVLNPAELLKQARESQRLSDLDAMRNAIALYLADAISPVINTDNTRCYQHANGSTTTACGGRFSSGTNTTSTSQVTDGNGWMPINISGISSGAPLAKWPVDPTNDTTYYYAYKANSSDFTFEINANLESTKYSPKEATDGGNSTTTYEIGTDPGLDI